MPPLTDDEKFLRSMNGLERLISLNIQQCSLASLHMSTTLYGFVFAINWEISAVKKNKEYVHFISIKSYLLVATFVPYSYHQPLC